MKTIKARICGETYTACFTDGSHETIKETKKNEALETEYAPEAGWWSVFFEDKENEKHAMCVHFRLGKYGERTDEPIEATLLNEDGVIIDAFPVE